jgi:hypothetical protein
VAGPARWRPASSGDAVGPDGIGAAPFAVAENFRLQPVWPGGGNAVLFSPVYPHLSNVKNSRTCFSFAISETN